MTTQTQPAAPLCPCREPADDRCGGLCFACSAELIELDQEASERADEARDASAAFGLDLDAEDVAAPVLDGPAVWAAQRWDDERSAEYYEPDPNNTPRPWG